MISVTNAKNAHSYAFPGASIYAAPGEKQCPNLALFGHFLHLCAVVGDGVKAPEQEASFDSFMHFFFKDKFGIKHHPISTYTMRCTSEVCLLLASTVEANDRDRQDPHCWSSILCYVSKPSLCVLQAAVLQSCSVSQSSGPVSKLRLECEISFLKFNFSFRASLFVSPPCRT